MRFPRGHRKNKKKKKKGNDVVFGTLEQVLHNVMRSGLSVADAVRTARLSAQAQSLRVEVENAPENRFSGEFLEALAKTSAHRILPRLTPLSVAVNVVSKTADALASQSDNRGGGFAVKYGP